MQWIQVINTLTLTRRGRDIYAKGREQGERRQGRRESAQTVLGKKMFLRACLKLEMSHFSFICFWFQKGRKVKASLF